MIITLTLFVLFTCGTTMEPRVGGRNGGGANRNLPILARAEILISAAAAVANRRFLKSWKRLLLLLLLLRLQRFHYS